MDDKNKFLFLKKSILMALNKGKRKITSEKEDNFDTVQAFIGVIRRREDEEETSDLVGPGAKKRKLNEELSEATEQVQNIHELNKMMELFTELPVPVIRTILIYLPATHLRDVVASNYNLFSVASELGYVTELWMKENFAVSDKLAVAIRNYVLNFVFDAEVIETEEPGVTITVLGENGVKDVVYEIKRLSDLRQTLYDTYGLSSEESNALLGWMHGVVDDIKISYEKYPQTLLDIKEPATFINNYMISRIYYKRGIGRSFGYDEIKYLNHYSTMVQHSIYKGHIDVVEFLIKNSTGLYNYTKPNLVFDNSYLSIAIIGGNVPIIKWLMDRTYDTVSHRTEIPIFLDSIGKASVVSKKSSIPAYSKVFSMEGYGQDFVDLLEYWEKRGRYLLPVRNYLVALSHLSRNSEHIVFAKWIIEKQVKVLEGFKSLKKEERDELQKKAPYKSEEILQMVIEKTKDLDYFMQYQRIFSFDKIKESFIKSHIKLGSKTVPAGSKKFNSFMTTDPFLRLLESAAFSNVEILKHMLESKDNVFNDLRIIMEWLPSTLNSSMNNPEYTESFDYLLSKYGFFYLNLVKTYSKDEKLKFVRGLLFQSVRSSYFFNKIFPYAKQYLGNNINLIVTSLEDAINYGNVENLSTIESIIEYKGIRNEDGVLIENYQVNYKNIEYYLILCFQLKNIKTVEACYNWLMSYAEKYKEEINQIDFFSVLCESVKTYMYDNALLLIKKHTELVQLYLNDKKNQKKIKPVIFVLRNEISADSPESKKAYDILVYLHSKLRITNIFKIIVDFFKNMIIPIEFQIPLYDQYIKIVGQSIYHGEQIFRSVLLKQSVKMMTYLIERHGIEDRSSGYIVYVLFHENGKFIINSQKLGIFKYLAKKFNFNYTDFTRYMLDYTVYEQTGQLDTEKYNRKTVYILDNLYSKILSSQIRTEILEAKENYNASVQYKMNDVEEFFPK